METNGVGLGEGGVGDGGGVEEGSSRERRVAQQSKGGEVDA